MPFDANPGRRWFRPGSAEERAAIEAWVVAGLVNHLSARRAHDLPARQITAKPSPRARGMIVDGSKAEARFLAGIFGQRAREARVEARVLLARYAFNRATQAQRHAASLRLAGAKNKDVARVLQVSEPTAHVTYGRGLARMRRALQDHETVISETAKNWAPAVKSRGTSLERFLSKPTHCVRTNEAQPMTDDLLTPVECAAIARTSMASLYRRWAEDGGPRSFRLGRKRLVRRADLFSWLAGMPAAD